MMHKFSVKSIAAALLALTFCAGVQAYDLKNPALTPVQIKKAEKHSPLQLVKNGKLQFAIIADLNQEHRSSRGWSINPAVEELKTAFQRCTGMTPEVFSSKDLSAAQKKYPYVISVGNNPLSVKYVDAKKLKQEGFEVVTFPKGIVICGMDSTIDPTYNKDPLDMKGEIRGTLWGAYDFMERVMGVR